MKRAIDSKNREKRVSHLFVALFFLAWWGFYLLQAPYHLHFKEQLTLFGCDDLAFYLQKPAWLAEISGDYLTQFFLLEGGGCSILVGLLVVLWLGLRLAFKRLGVARYAHLWALLPVAVEGALSFHLEYPLSMVIGALLSVWAFVGLSFIKSRLLLRLVAVVAVPPLYLLIGAHFLLFPLLVILHGFRRGRPLSYTLSLALVVVATPLVAGYLLYLTPAQSYFYPLIDRYMLQVPFIFILTEMACLATYLLATFRPSGWIALGLGCFMPVASLSLMWDGRAEYDLGFLCEAYYGRWNRVLELSREGCYNTYLSSYYTNLAYAREGRLPDSLLHHYQPAHYGLLLEIKESTGYLHAMAAPDALMEQGDMAQAQHAAMLAMTFTPHQRSSRMVRKLAEIAMINAEHEVARRYLRMLSKTSLHSRWAAQGQASIDEDRLPANTRALLVQNDTLFAANDWRKSLVNLLESNPANQTAADYLLCYHLLRKDLAQFKLDYDAYYHPTFGATPPQLYQEAILPCLEPDKELAEQLAYYHIPVERYDICLDYLSRYEQSKGDGRPLEKQYGKSYWFYYYYAQIKQP